MIEFNNISKNYGLTKALNDVSFSVKKGEIIGFVGPNGAGKTTAMKIITTYTAPSAGTARVGNYDVQKNPLEVRDLIGYLPESVPLYDEMLVSEYLEFIGNARHLNGNLKKRFDWVVQACGLETMLNRKIGFLSKGFRQRTCLAQALIHDPEVLILDEPTSGLDPIQIISIRNMIKELAHEKTIILSTHILPEVSNISDRILVINKGKLVADGTFQELIQQVSIHSSIYLAVKTSKKDFENGIRNIPEIKDITFDHATKRGVTGAHLYYSGKIDMIKKLNEVIQNNKWEVIEFHPEKLSLENTFIRLTQSNEPEKQAETGGKKL
ncbi:MAG: ATP-binding cassette domain-containing protein [bacterium]